MRPIETIESDDEIPPEEASDEEEDDARGKLKLQKISVFRFDYDDGSNVQRFRGSVEDEEDKMAEDEEIKDSSTEEEDDGDNQSLADNVRVMPHAEERAVRASEKMHRKDVAAAERKWDSSTTSGEMDSQDEADYFDSVIEALPPASGAESGTSNTDRMFTELGLSRPLLRGVEAAGYVTATPIQVAVIPLAMAGRDVCASAVTGSGKTAAFVLPFLERLLYRRKDVATTRVLVVTPTRELATQIFSVLQKLSHFTDVTSVLVCGGKKDLKSQEAALRLRPDVIVCTPGRIIDHLRNSHSVNVDDLDVLVLDEVDRLLDLGFQEEIEELLRHCPAARQTLLFSATMTPKVDDLVKLSLRQPVRVKTASGTTAVAHRLVQEFVKVRSPDETEAIMAALVCRSFQKRCIVFFETKRETHRFFLLLGLLGIRASELHGDVSQVQRYQSLEKFRTCAVDVMVATDVAARGLDIPGVLTVLNSEMPRNASTYVHRVGRTARAGCGGRSVTLVTDARRKVMKEILKNKVGVEADPKTQQQVLSRTVPAAVISDFLLKIASFEQDLVAVMREERLQAKIREVGEEVERAENLLIHEAEIAARPARTWYQTETQKKEQREASTAHAKEEEKQAAGAGSVSAQSRAVALSLADDYRRDENEKAKGGKGKDADGHRLSRKKRRRLEALQESSEDADDQAVSGPSPAKRVRKQTLSSAEEKKMRDNRIISTANGASLKTVSRPKFAVGGLDRELSDWSGGGGVSSVSGKPRKAADRKEGGGVDFKDFDPSKKLKKGGKVGKSTFKSKSKFKRR